MGTVPESAYFAALKAALSFADARKDCIEIEATSTLEIIPSPHKNTLLALLRSLEGLLPTDETNEREKIIKTRGTRSSDERKPKMLRVRFILIACTLAELIAPNESEIPVIIGIKDEKKLEIDSRLSQTEKTRERREEKIKSAEIAPIPAFIAALSLAPKRAEPDSAREEKSPSPRSNKKKEITSPPLEEKTEISSERSLSAPTPEIKSSPLRFEFSGIISIKSLSESLKAPLDERDFCAFEKRIFSLITLPPFYDTRLKAIEKISEIKGSATAIISNLPTRVKAEEIPTSPSSRAISAEMPKR
jgi:hypothetical protein